MAAEGPGRTWGSMTTTGSRNGGRLVWQKGFHELFEAAERLRDAHPE